jgi:hypothetical protein
MSGDHFEQRTRGDDVEPMGPEERALVIDVSRDVVAELAPGEIAVFRPVAKAFYEDPRRLTSETGDAMLGFGPGEAVTLLTPIVLAVMGEVVAFLRADLAKAIPRAMADSLEDSLRALFHKFHGGEGPAAAVPPLTHEQLSRVRAIAFDKARQGGLSERRAELLADATVGSLVLTG